MITCTFEGFRDIEEKISAIRLKAARKHKDYYKAEISSINVQQTINNAGLTHPSHGKICSVPRLNRLLYTR